MLWQPHCTHIFRIYEKTFKFGFRIQSNGRKQSGTYLQTNDASFFLNMCKFIFFSLKKNFRFFPSFLVHIPFFESFIPHILLLYRFNKYHETMRPYMNDSAFYSKFYNLHILFIQSLHKRHEKATFILLFYTQRMK